MTPRGSDQLFARRMTGWKPGFVWIDFGPGKTINWAADNGNPWLRVIPTDPLDRLDWRCIVGLDVILEPVEWCDKAAKLYERLQDYAETITVVSQCFEPEMGWAWHQRYGRRELGELKYIAALQEAQSDCTKWAVKRNDNEYRAAQAREMKILEEAPWLRS